MNPIRVILVDDHKMVRVGIRVLLSTMGNIQVVAEADNGYDALRQIDSDRPDVVLLDITLPGLNGLEVAKHVLANFSGVHVIMLSTHVNEEYILTALRLGASGYLSKDTDPAELEAAIKAAIRNDVYLNPEIAKRIAEYKERIDEPNGKG